MYVIDDGSTDQTAAVVKSYIPKFERRGYALTYIYQAHAGQSFAINNGLQYVKGEFLVWPDSDDYYAADTAIEQMANVLKSSTDEFAMVRTQENIVEDADEIRILRVNGLHAKEEEDQSLFEDCLLSQNDFYFCSGAYMIRLRCLLETSRFPLYQMADAGQNWQLLLPVLYHYRCKTILKPLYHVTERLASHNRGQYQGLRRQLIRLDAYEQTSICCLDSIIGMPEELQKKYKRIIRKKYGRAKSMMILISLLKTMRIYAPLRTLKRRLSERIR
jgi:glycosyltransferase involved in cell wall biosynthesis